MKKSNSFSFAFILFLFTVTTASKCVKNITHREYKLKESDIQNIRMMDKNYFPSGTYEQLDSGNNVVAFTYASMAKTAYPGGDRPDSVYYFRKDRYIFNAENIKDIQITKSEAGEKVLSIQLDEIGSTRFADYTATHVQKLLPVILNNKIVMAPLIFGKITGGMMEISGNFTEEELERFKAILEYERDYLKRANSKK